MVLLVFGFLLIVIGVFTISFPTLAKALKELDTNQFLTLGKPTGYNIMDNGKTLGLFSWVLSKGFENCKSEKILTIGKKAYHRAIIAKHTMITGVILMVIGCGLAIF